MEDFFKIGAIILSIVGLGLSVVALLMNHGVIPA
nr:MAG TPA: hypothetical protein [Caudoviricetes sp.]